MTTEQNCLLEWIYDTVAPPTDSCRAWAQTALGKHPSHLFAHATLQQARVTHLQLVADHPSSISAVKVPVCHINYPPLGHGMHEVVASRPASSGAVSITRFIWTIQCGLSILRACCRNAGAQWQLLNFGFTVQTASSQDALPKAAVIFPVPGPWVPSVEYAHTQLLKALRDMQAWQCMLDDGTKLLRDMLESRLSHKELGTKHDLRYRACALAFLQMNTCSNRVRDSVISACLGSPSAQLLHKT